VGAGGEPFGVGGVGGVEGTFASEVLAKVRTFDGLIGALEQFD